MLVLAVRQTRTRSLTQAARATQLTWTKINGGVDKTNDVGKNTDQIAKNQNKGQNNEQNELLLGKIAIETS